MVAIIYPTTPAPADYSRRWAPQWNGVAHHDFCQRMSDGQAIFHVVDRYGYPPRYTAYGSEETDLLAWSDPDGTIHVRAQTVPHFNGKICVGVEDQ